MKSFHFSMRVFLVKCLLATFLWFRFVVAKFKVVLLFLSNWNFFFTSTILKKFDLLSFNFRSHPIFISLICFIDCYQYLLVLISLKNFASLKTVRNLKKSIDFLLDSRNKCVDKADSYCSKTRALELFKLLIFFSFSCLTSKSWTCLYLNSCFLKTSSKNFFPSLITRSSFLTS